MIFNCANFLLKFLLIAYLIDFKIALNEHLLSIIFLALIRPSCLFPMLIVGFLKDGVSKIPLDEFPTTTSQNSL